MESILAVYAEPVPRVILATTPWEGGTAGLIEVFSDRRDLPYKLLRRPRSAAELARVGARDRNAAMCEDAEAIGVKPGQVHGSWEAVMNARVQAMLQALRAARDELGRRPLAAEWDRRPAWLVEVPTWSRTSAGDH